MGNERSAPKQQVQEVETPLTEIQAGKPSKKEAKKNKKHKHDAKVLAKISNQSLIEVVEDGKVNDVKVKIELIRKQLRKDIENDLKGKPRFNDPEVEFTKRLREEVNRLDEDGLSALHYAARDEHPDIVKELLAAEADPNVRNKKGSTPLHAAAKSVHDSSLNLEDVITILLKNNANVNVQDNHGITPIHLAAYRDNVVGIEKLLQDENINIHLKDNDGQTVLHKAACSDANHAIATLQNKLEVDDVKAKDNAGQTALHVACKFGGSNSFSTLLDIFKERNQDMKTVLTKKDKEGNTPLHLAAASGDEETLDAFIRSYQIETRTHPATLSDEEDDDDWSWNDDDFGLDDEDDGTKALTIKQMCMMKTNDGETPLHLAAMAGNLSNVITILDEMDKTEIDVEDKMERSPLQGAVIYNNTEVVELLVDRGAKIDHYDTNWHSTVLVAAKVSTAQITEILLRKDPTGYEMRYDTDEDEKNPLHVAAERDDPDILKVLLKYCQDTDDHWLLDTPDRNNNAPLHIAAEKGKTECVQALLNFNAEVDLKNADLNTPAHLAAKNGRTLALDALAKHERDVLKTGDEDANTALHIACHQGHEQAVKLLIKAGADIGARNRRIHTPLYVAAKRGHLKICKHLLKAGANPNPRVMQTLTPADASADVLNAPLPLHAACKEGHAELVTMLLKFNADVTTRDENGNNCLNIAILHGQRDAAIAILKSDKWQEALRNESEEFIPKRKRTTPFRQLIERMPDVAQTVLDLCVNFESNIDPKTGKPKTKMYEERRIELDYQFLEDEQAPWRKRMRISATGHLRRDLLAARWARKQHPLKLMADLKRANLLEHPLTTSLLDRKWWQTIWMYFFIFLIYAIYLTFLTGYMIVNNPPYIYKNSTAYDSSIDDECERILRVDPDLEGFDSAKRIAFIQVGQWIILIVSIISVLGELLQFVYRGRKYIRSPENYIDLISYVFAICLVVNSNECQRETGIRTDIKWQLGAFSMFLSWVNLVLFYKMFPRLGMYVYMFSAITKSFLGVIRVFVFFIVAFGLTFYVLMQNQVEFDGVWTSLVKSTIMTTGEFEFYDIIHGEEDNPGEFGHMVFYETFTEVLLIIFAGMMTVLLMNLLVGLAVGDIQGLQANAVLQKLRIQVEQILDAEYYWLFTTLRWRLQKKLVLEVADHKHIHYDDLKAVASRDDEEAKQLNLELTRQEIQGRIHKQLNRQQEHLSFVMEKLEAQEKQNEETQKMLRKVLRQLNADKDLEHLPFKLVNNTDAQLKCVLDWGGILKTNRMTLDPAGEWSDSMEDEPHTLFVFMDDTKLAHSFKPGKNNEMVITKEEGYLKLTDQDNYSMRVEIVAQKENNNNDDEEDW